MGIPAEYELAPRDRVGALPPGDWHRIFDALHEEHDYVVDEIEGRLPKGLCGTLYRNGPGKRQQGGSWLSHALEGDGMVSAFTFDGHVVRFRNRYVRTPGYLRGLDGSAGICDRTVGTLVPGGPEANSGREITQHANTHVLVQSDRLLAIDGGAMPWALDPVTLETMGQWDYAGMLTAKRRSASAHPKIDPRTQELFNFSVEAGPTPMLHTFRVDSSGRGTLVESVSVPFADWVHDFAITERYLVFSLSPFQIDRDKVAAGSESPMAALHLDSKLGSRFVVIPRDGGEAKIIEHESFAFFHFTNAYEEGEEIVLELARFERSWNELNDSMFNYRTGRLDYLANRLWQFRIARSGRVSGEPVSEHLSDWPSLDWRRVGSRHRFSYHTTIDPRTAAGGLAKIDHRSNKSKHHALPAGHVAGEPSFVPLSTKSAEDEGWVLFVAYDPDRHRSRLVVLDASGIDGPPVAVAHLRHHIPLAFHGSFTSRGAS
jgi:all-trans-8'-apo-beta-carotenal 15,15'-oxygenase